MMSDRKQPPPEHKPSVLQLVGSVIAAAFGVQSSRNRQRDFTHGKARNFIIAGLVFTALFVLTVYLVVSTVLEQTAR